MGKNRIWLAAALLIPSCGGHNEVEEPKPDTSASAGDLNVDHSAYEHPRTSELGTELTRNLSKTIEWPDVSTEEKTTYLGGTVVVDKIFRMDADDFYGVRVRMVNTTTQCLKLQYLIRFYDAKGARVTSFYDTRSAQNINQEDEYRAFVVDPHDGTIISDFCRTKGAVGFRLCIRGAGSKDEGLPDSALPKKEEKK